MSSPGLSDDEDRLVEYLIDWEESQSTSSPLSAEEACAGRPDLVEELKQRISAICELNKLLFAPDDVNSRVTIGLGPRNVSDAFPHLPGYQIVREIGRGGMGIVYLARHERLNRLVAVKTVQRGRWVTPRLVASLKSEGEILARLQHPGIVRIYDVLEVDGELNLVLEYVNGQSLAQAFRHSIVPPKQAAQYASQLATTLVAVHAKGILHRDIKPGNVLVDDEGHVKLTDFGSAKELLTDSSHTLSGDVIGSPSYMAPEQAAGKHRQITERTDLYGIGATLYELLTGQPPFQGSSVLETMTQIMEDEPIPPRERVGAIPIDLETICLKCLEKEPGRRYVSAMALSDDLGRYLRGVPVVA